MVTRTEVWPIGSRKNTPTDADRFPLLQTTMDWSSEGKHLKEDKRVTQSQNNTTHSLLENVNVNIEYMVNDVSESKFFKC